MVDPDIHMLPGLGSLGPAAKGAFAAACAQRMLPLYDEYVQRTGDGDQAAVSAVLDRLWARLEADPDADVGQLESLADEAEGYVPDGDGPTADDEYFAYAENAVAAVVYAAGASFRPGKEDAVWAAEMPIQALESRLDIIADGQTYRVDQSSGRHPAVVAERRRQQRDLAELTAAEAGPALPGAVAGVHARALEQPITLDWPTELLD